jgi:sucrose-6-phosphatase
LTRLLLCTDLDRTLLPNGQQKESAQARKMFCALSSRPEVTLTYVSGRDKKLVLQAIKEFKIPLADFIITDVGSSIYEIKDEQWDRWHDWDTEIEKDWQKHSSNQLHNLISDLGQLKLQEESKQKKHKLSYYVSLTDNHKDLFNLIYDRLKQKNIHSNIIWSIDEIKNIGLLDILPASAGKLQAIKFLMKQKNYNLNETVFAGDSGNDLCVISSDIKSVLVANADKETRLQAENNSIQNKQSSSLYLAQGNYLGMNGNYSAGILEGVAHYLPEAENWFKDN